MKHCTPHIIAHLFLLPRQGCTLFVRLPLCVVVVILLVCQSETVIFAQHYRIGLYQGIAIPQRTFAEITPVVNWYPSINAHFFGKNTPITMGASASFQYFPRNAEAQKAQESYETTLVPLSLCFQYLLLPPPFRPYYGLEAGLAWYRYQFYNGERPTERLNNTSLVVTPNAGVKIELFDQLDLEINVRYQFVFHDIIPWGNAGKVINGYQMLAFSLGVNYQLWKIYP
ncbi:MAG: hypothetical protein EAZ92_06520 [Candidatus Kapaibacterium sp.]|nr:MAG: hypothetical protein EAZ92_06520 [Candidatus Kapabacteria bacterium]